MIYVEQGLDAWEDGDYLSFTWNICKAIGTWLVPGDTIAVAISKGVQKAWDYSLGRVFKNNTYVARISSSILKYEGQIISFHMALGSYGIFDDNNFFTRREQRKEAKELEKNWKKYWSDVYFEVVYINLYDYYVDVVDGTGSIIYSNKNYVMSTVEISGGGQKGESGSAAASGVSNGFETSSGSASSYTPPPAPIYCKEVYYVPYIDYSYYGENGMVYL